MVSVKEQKPKWIEVLKQCVAVALVSLIPHAAFATSIEMFFTGLDLEYDDTATGGDIVTQGGVDDLVSLDVVVDGSLAERVDGATAELLLANLTGQIPAAGGSVTGITGGFTLTAGGGSLELNFDDATVIWAAIGDVKVVFSEGTSADWTSSGGIFDTYPFVPDSTISLSFSEQVDGYMDDGTYVTMFDSSGTGEVSGQLIPEPATAVLLGLGIAGLGLAGRRRAARL